MALSGGRTLVEKRVGGREESGVGRLNDAGRSEGESFGECETEHCKYGMCKV